MIENYLPAASTYANDIDNVVLLIAVLTGFWFFLTLAIFIGFIVVFRAKPGVPSLYITGEKHSEMRFIHWPHNLVLVCDILIIVAAVRVWVDVKQTLPPADATVRIIAQQWAWSFVHPGPDGVLDSEDDIPMGEELHLEVGKTYHYKLEARDVMHSFSVPVFRLKQDAVPGRVITGWFTPTKVGQFDIQCAEMCGVGHGLMPARLYVEAAAEHAAWMATHKSDTSLAAATPR